MVEEKRNSDSSTLAENLKQETTINKSESFVDVSSTEKNEEIVCINFINSTSPEPFPSYEKYMKMSNDEKRRLWKQIHIIVEDLVSQNIDPFSI